MAKKFGSYQVDYEGGMSIGCGRGSDNISIR